MRSLTSILRVGAGPVRMCLAIVGALFACGCQDEGAAARGRAARGDDMPGPARGGDAGTSGSASASDGGAGHQGGAGEVLSVGPWTAVTQMYLGKTNDGTPAWPGTAQVLSDGRVLASGPGANTAWYTFAPDAQGSYQNGAWAPAATAPVGRLFHPGFVLRDGRYWAGGGEYMGGSTTRAENELYDPETDTWSVLPDMPQEIADTPSAILGDGRVLVISHLWTSANTYLLSLDPFPTWSLAAPWSHDIGDAESNSSLLGDGSVLVGSLLFQLYQPQKGAWVDAAPPPGGAGTFVPPGSDEMGAILVLHDGRAFVLGATNKNAFFTVGGPGGAGSWTTAADTPAPYNHGDAPAVVEPNGKVLTVVTNDESGEGYASAVFYEYDPAVDTWSLLSTPFTFDNAERVTLLALPNGQIWASGPNNPRAWLYTPTGEPKTEWKPSIAGVAVPTVGSLRVTGVRLNGMTTGADFGDDGKMATNFPIVSFADAGGASPTDEASISTP